jgi:nitrogen PTS system EIIA component
VRPGTTPYPASPKCEAARNRPALPMILITMASLIAPARVIPDLRARDLRQVVGEMTRIAAQETPVDPAAAQEAVLTRGQSSSFAFGRGVVLPHAMIADLEQPMGVFARLSPALDLDAPDNRPVDLALLILSADGDEATLLRTLACAARRLRDREVTARLRSADGAEALLAVLTSDVWRGEADNEDTPLESAPQGEEFDKSVEVLDDQDIMLSSAQIDGGLHRSGNLIVGN